MTAGMTMEFGLFDRMVLQHNRRGVCDVRFGGTCASRGKVVARVTKSRKTVNGFAVRKVGAAQDGRFEGRLTGLKTGGPYDIELSIAGASNKEKLRVKSVLVGDVWVCAGQSNMQGLGLLKDAVKPHAMVRALYLNGRWDTAKEPINERWDAEDEVYRGTMSLEYRRRQRCLFLGTGPAVAFGQAMRRRTGVPQGLIPCAVSGSALRAWDPALKQRGEANFYTGMFRQFNKHGARSAGVLWYQGESDVFPPDVSLYTERMKTLMAAIRSDLGDARLPLVFVQIGRRTGYQDGWNDIQEQQRRLSETIPYSAMVPAIDLPLEDVVHISGAGQRRLGERLAYAMAVMKQGRKAGLPPIAVKSITLTADPDTGKMNLLVRFDHVVGELRSAGRPHGFTVVDSSGALTGVDVQPHDVLLRGRDVVLRLDSYVPPEQLATWRVHYGWGTIPYCNITDDAGRSLPVFGPLPIKTGPVTPFVRRARISKPVVSESQLRNLPFPANLDSLDFKAREFRGHFLDVHKDFTAVPKSNLIYMACAIECAEPMRLRALLGHDGPIRVWLAGRLIHYGAKGDNPAVFDSVKIPFMAAAGRHELLIALDANNGYAWGVFLRFERLDVSKELPEILG